MFENFKKLLGRRGQSIPLPAGYDQKIFDLVMERSISQEQQANVLRTTYHLSQLWNGRETAGILEVIAVNEPTYPHLARMADLEMFGEEWLAELAKVVEMTTGAADNLVGQSDHFKQLLRDAYENIK